MNEHSETVAATPSVESERAPRTVGDIIAVMDRAYPPHYAENRTIRASSCGDPDAVVNNKVCCAVDLTPETLNRVVSTGRRW
ncbi:MAG: hypothetical protein U1U88_002284 [Lawsonella clevelandensis]